MPPEAHVTIFSLSGEHVYGVTITELGYYDLCQGEGADQEPPDPRSPNVTLSVTISPDGAGWVRSSPYVIDCPTACSQTIDRDSILTLTATPTSGFTFTGWAGACTGTGACIVTLNDAAGVVANFSGKFEAPPPPPKPPQDTTDQTTTGGSG
jgi:hypothetical protein